MNMEKLTRREYEDFLSEDEIQLAITFYEYTGNTNKTIIICDNLKIAFYGKTFGCIDTAAVNEINEEIAKSVCLKLIGRDEKYFDSLPIDLQDDVIELYEKVLDEEELRDKLLELLKIKPCTVRLNNNEKKGIKPKEEIKSQKKPSLLARLREYQRAINRKSQVKI